MITNFDRMLKFPESFICDGLIVSMKVSYHKIKRHTLGVIAFVKNEGSDPTGIVKLNKHGYLDLETLYSTYQ